MKGPENELKEQQLDAEIIAMAQQGRTRWPLPFDEPSIADARAAYSERYRIRSLPPRTNVLVEHLKIPGRAVSMAARSYRPTWLRPELAPMIVYFHGGGFVLGDADGYEWQSMRLAEEVGCTVLFPEYRLAPEHPFPAAVHDAIDVMDWVERHAPQLGFDTSRLVVMGDSAGGNLAANICLAMRERGGPAIALQFLLYPWTDCRPYCGGPGYASVDAFSSGYLLDRSVMEWFTRNYIPDTRLASDPRASPMLAPDLSELPPAVIVTAGCDPLRDMGEEFAKRLAQAGNAVECDRADHLAHNFMAHVASSARARHAFESVVELLRRHLSSGVDLAPPQV